MPRSCVFEVAAAEPLAALDAQVAQQGDVGRWTAEADASDPSPLRDDRATATRRRRHRTRDGPSSARRVSSDRRVGTARRRCRMGLAAGSACRPVRRRCRCGTSRRRRGVVSTSASRSSTMKWMRFQPPGPGVAPSGIGRPAELFGPARSSRRLPRLTSANAGAALVSDLEAEKRGVEGDRLVDVVDHVADADGLIVWHGRTSSSVS